MHFAPLLDVCRCGCGFFFLKLLSHISLKPGGLVIPRGLTIVFVALPAACPPADQEARLFVERELQTVN